MEPPLFPVMINRQYQTNRQLNESGGKSLKIIIHSKLRNTCLIHSISLVTDILTGKQKKYQFQLWDNNFLLGWRPNWTQHTPIDRSCKILSNEHWRSLKTAKYYSSIVDVTDARWYSSNLRIHWIFQVNSGTFMMYFFISNRNIMFPDNGKQSFALGPRWNASSLWSPTFSSIKMLIFFRYDVFK